MAELKAIVYGTGFAGQGHATALTDCGVDTVCLVGRTPQVTELVAGRLGIPHRTTDLGDAFARHEPDLIAIGTPGGAHVELPLQGAGTAGRRVGCRR